LLPVALLSACSPEPACTPLPGTQLRVRAEARLASEALGHYVESLGLLLAEPGVSWTKADKTKVCAWLRDLETARLAEVDAVPVQHLAHLVSGLTQIEANKDRLQ